MYLIKRIYIFPLIKLYLLKAFTKKSRGEELPHIDHSSGETIQILTLHLLLSDFDLLLPFRAFSDTQTIWRNPKFKILHRIMPQVRIIAKNFMDMVASLPAMKLDKLYDNPFICEAILRFPLYLSVSRFFFFFFFSSPNFE